MEIKVKHIVVILAVVAMIAMLMLVPANAEYLSITLERNSVANAIRSGMCEFSALEGQYQSCVERLSALEQMSDYGKILANLDQSGLGRVLIALLVIVQIVVIIFAGMFIVTAFAMMIKREIRKARRKMRRKMRQAKVRRVRVKCKNSEGRDVD